MVVCFVIITKYINEIKSHLDYCWKFCLVSLFTMALLDQRRWWLMWPNCLIGIRLKIMSTSWPWWGNCTRVWKPMRWSREEWICRGGTQSVANALYDEKWVARRSKFYRNKQTYENKSSKCVNWMINCFPVAGKTELFLVITVMNFYRLSFSCFGAILSFDI